jgi:hypothetical protein
MSLFGTWLFWTHLFSLLWCAKYFYDLLYVEKGCDYGAMVLVHSCLFEDV